VSDDGYINGDVLDVPNVNDYVVGVDYAAPGTEPAPEQKTQKSASFDPGEHTVADVEAYIAKHPDQRDAVLEAEKSGKARATLVGD
jgi:hypothetical protein